MIEPHMCCKLPEDGENAVWRYMSLGKFLDLLENVTLWFAKLDTLSDPLEGSLTDPSYESMKLFEYGLTQMESSTFSAEVMRRQMYRINQKLMFVNCGHMNESESAAMWRQYSGEGVAIRSTFRRLVQALEPTNQKINVGLIQYFDYSKHHIPYNNTLAAVMSKRLAFEYEKEVHASFSIHPASFTSGDLLDEHLVNQPAGQPVPVDLTTLISDVYLSPTQSNLLRSLVPKIIARYGLSVPVTTSDLGRVPEL